jgi:rhomboid protease GluP
MNDYPPPYSSPPPQPPSRRVPVEPRAEKPTVVYGLMGVTIAVYLLQMLSQWFLGADYPAALGMKVNELIMRGELWRLFTPMFLHGSILHIGFNMYALYILGPGMERYYGHTRFLGLYILAGFAGNVGSFLFASSPSLGSSTAIFGLLGAQGVFVYRNRQVFGAMAQRVLMNIVLIAGVNLLIGLSPGIDNWGHVGGLIGGTLFAWYAGPLYRLEGGYFAPMVVDEHDDGDAVRTGLAVGALFAILAGVKIYLGA